MFVGTEYSQIPMGDLEQSPFQPFIGTLSQTNDALQLNQRTRYHRCSQSSTKCKWEDEQYALLPSRVVGYQFSTRNWCELRLEGLEKIPPEKQENSAAFDQLQLERSSKELMKSLIRSHKTRDQRGPKPLMKDFVEGKGDGLTFLLHGESSLNPGIQIPINSNRRTGYGQDFYGRLEVIFGLCFYIEANNFRRKSGYRNWQISVPLESRGFRRQHFIY
jgi:hypothetical protein